MDTGIRQLVQLCALGLFSIVIVWSFLVGTASDIAIVSVLGLLALIALKVGLVALVTADLFIRPRRDQSNGGSSIQPLEARTSEEPFSGEESLAVGASAFGMSVSSRPHGKSGRPFCPICGGDEFVDFNGRPNARCISCRSLERHRVCFEVYQREGLFRDSGTRRRLLQLAPEKVTFEVLSKIEHIEYMCADLEPRRYKHAQPFKIRIPGDLMVFPDGYFDYLIHNHVWEHIPGSWVDHVQPFRRLLSMGGKMIFTVPFSTESAPAETLEFGELLPTDEDRLRVFGQADHVRRFGLDFPAAMARVEGLSFRMDDLTREEKKAIAGLPGGLEVTVFIMERIS